MGRMMPASILPWREKVIAKKPTFSLSQMSRMMPASILSWREKVVAMKPTPGLPLTPLGEDSGARD
jgi:hypothetical protein